jgi:hypothetical protein
MAKVIHSDMLDGTQELGLKLPAPEVTPEQVKSLVCVLSVGAKSDKNKGWMTAVEIAPMMGGVSERKVRKIASVAAPVVVSFPGSPGYKLWSACSVDEINHAIASFEAQATDMIKRANLYRQAYHRRFRGGQADGI